MTQEQFNDTVTKMLQVPPPEVKLKLASEKPPRGFRKGDEVAVEKVVVRGNPKELKRFGNGFSIMHGTFRAVVRFEELEIVSITPTEVK